jgi:hypothetical protein
MWEVGMNVQRNLLWLNLILLTAIAANSAVGQQQPAAAPAGAPDPSMASIPDFSGIWRHGSLPWFVPPASGPGPVTNRSRRQDNGTSDYGKLVGDYTNPILQPWAATVVKQKGDISIAGADYPNPANQCWPEPVPFLFKHMAMQMLQRPNEIIMLFSEDHEVRRVRLNATHPAQPIPSWHGDAVGRYDGDALVVDTVAIKPDRPFAMIDLFGTPYTDKLHVVERYRLADYEAVKNALARGVKENWRPAGPPRADYKDKYLRVDFTIEDAGTFTTPWTASMVYQRDRLEWPEIACAENTFGFHHGADADVPQAQRPDF